MCSKIAARPRPARVLVLGFLPLMGFSPPVSYTAGSFPRSVATGDFNADGTPDLAVANYNGGIVSALLGNGDGTFQNAFNYATGAVPIWVAVGDFNGDRNQDLAVDNATEPGSVAVLLGNGDGSFQGPAFYPTGAWSRTVAVGDFNRDGNHDLVTTSSLQVCDEGGCGVQVLLGNGDGSFQDAAFYAAGSAPYSVAVGDFNGDGNQDLVTANIDDSVSLLVGNGDGSFQDRTDYPAGRNPISAAVEDFNGDGFPDVVVANWNSNTVSVLLNQGNWPSAAGRR